MLNDVPWVCVWLQVKVTYGCSVRSVGLLTRRFTSTYVPRLADRGGRPTRGPVRAVSTLSARRATRAVDP